MIGVGDLSRRGRRRNPSRKVPNVPGRVNDGSLGRGFLPVKSQISRVASIDVNELGNLYTRAVAIRLIACVPGNHA